MGGKRGPRRGAAVRVPSAAAWTADPACRDARPPVEWAAVDGRAREGLWDFTPQNRSRVACCNRLTKGKISVRPSTLSDS